MYVVWHDFESQYFDMQLLGNLMKNGFKAGFNSTYKHLLSALGTPYQVIVD